MPIPFAVGFLIAYVGALMVFVVWHAYRTKGGWQTLLMLTASFLIAFTAEALGVNAGLIFGQYHYTEALGIHVLGVPLLAALAWEPIVYAAFSITDILIPPQIQASRTRWDRLPAYVLMSLVGALATTAWDMMIDPIAVSEGWWVWENGGSYVPHLENGVPISNFLGWLGVAFVIHLLYRYLADTAPPGPRSANLSLRGPLLLYASLFLTASGVALTVLRRSDVALVGLLTMGPFLAIALANGRLAHRSAPRPVLGTWPSADDSRQTTKADHPTPWGN
jgi:putative membrane protein